MADTPVILPGYEAGPEANGMEHSREKLERASQALQSHLSSSTQPHPIEIQSEPCTTEEETWAYRCRCSFQLLQESSGGNSLQFRYAMRHKGEPIALAQNHFPIASKRIQRAMEDLANALTEGPTFNNDNNDREVIRCGLASVTFSSSWRDSTDQSADCIVTLNYSDRSLEETSAAWKQSAVGLCEMMNLRQLHGRSKKYCVSAKEAAYSTIRDSIFLDPSITTSFPTLATLEKASIMVTSTTNDDDIREIRYERADTSFYHPNAGVMLKALKWLLDRSQSITKQMGKACKLLELYCGCGAHTVALATSGMFELVEAIELDPRLVDACRHNIAINDLEQQVVLHQADAGVWAKRSYKWSQHDFDILLVDPPRAGLDERVCHMAISGTFQHMLYISCGHNALLRDLERLAGSFEVVQSSQLDLFPRTDSIETLVHLQRKSNT